MTESRIRYFGYSTSVKQNAKSSFLAILYMLMKKGSEFDLRIHCAKMSLIFYECECLEAELCKHYATM